MYYFCTLFDSNYLTRGLAMHDSLITHCPDFWLWILCMDELTFNVLTRMQLKNTSLIKLADFEDTELLKVKNSRTHSEYCWTCTPSLLLYIFRKFSSVKLLSYLDSDLFFYSSPEPVFEELKSSSVMIIPHRFVPWKKEKAKIVGNYNVSMVTFHRGKDGLSCLRWWKDKCLENCFNRPLEGQVGDQKYLDKFPRRFRDVHVLKHLGAGVATWNIPQYKLTEKRGKVFINDYPLIFFHFQGLKIYVPARFLTKVPPGSYGDRINYRQLIYEDYFNAIYRATGIVRKYVRGFALGFAPRPGLDRYVFEMLRDIVGRYRQFLRE